MNLLILTSVVGCIIALLLVPHLDFAASDVTNPATMGANYLIEQSQPAGTPERTEYEFKLAFDGRGLTLKDVSRSIARAIASTKQREPFALEQLFEGRFSTLDAFETFGFRDTYLDTRDFRLHEMRSAYRLRHRWSRFGLYLRHKIFPYLTAYYPSRAEIQFKTDYEDKGSNLMLAKETRFEFRRESDPFVKGEEVPPAPWPEMEYLAYARAGYYKDYRMLPSARAYQVARRARESIAFLPVFKVITARRRSHINAQNPWGRHPNPDQLFILTVDRSTVESIYPDFQGQLSIDHGDQQSLMEIEIELDRSTYTSMMEVAEKEIEDHHSLIEQYAIEFSRRALAAYEEDLAEIRRRVQEGLRADFAIEFAPSDYKYSRMLGTLRQRTTTEAH